MLNMKYCRTENVISALREWEGAPGTDEHLHHELAGLPRSLGYDFTHLPKIDAVIAKYCGHDG